MPDLSEQYRQLISIIASREWPISHLIEKVLPWVRAHGGAMSQDEKEAMRAAVLKSYALTDASLDHILLRELPLGSLIPPSAVEDDFVRLIPSAGLFRDVYTYTLNNEAPAPFHFFSFAVVLGAVIRRRIWLPMGHFNIYPNLSVIIVGPAGKVRKTTACDISMELAMRSSLIDVIGGEKATPEAIVDELANRAKAQGLIYAPELSVFLGKQDYNRGLIQLLTRLLDCPNTFPVSSVKNSKRELKDVCVSFLAASNEAWLVQSIPSDAFSGGFMGRILQVYQGGTLRSFPWGTVTDETLQSRIVEGLAEVVTCVGPVGKTSKAEKLWCEYYNVYKRDFPADERLGPVMERIPEQHLRLAIILAVAEAREERITLDERHIREAGAIITWIVKYLPGVYTYLGGTEVGEDARRILRILQSGRMSRSDIIKKMSHRLTARQCDERLATLVQARYLIEYPGAVKMYELKRVEGF